MISEDIAILGSLAARSKFRLPLLAYVQSDRHDMLRSIKAALMKLKGISRAQQVMLQIRHTQEHGTPLAADAVY